MIGLMDRSKTAADDRSITGTDFLQLDRAAAPAGGLTDWLAQQLRQAIADGRLLAGSKLPASRVLAGELRVSRGVVTEAYQRLAEDGQVAARGRAGHAGGRRRHRCPQRAAARLARRATAPAAAPQSLFRSALGADTFDAAAGRAEQDRPDPRRPRHGHVPAGRLAASRARGDGRACRRRASATATRAEHRPSGAP